MSEYWISPPHFGTLSKSSAATVVHTPRNVDLPAHVVLQDSKPEMNQKQKQRKRKCLCLSLWMLGLICVTAGAIVVAHFLMPETFQSNETSLMSHMQNCQDILPLEDKVINSDLVIVGSVLPDMSLEVVKIIKGHSLHRPKLPENGKACFENSAARQIFFLSTERQGRSVAEHEMDQLYIPKYPALIATPKIVDIVEKLALDIGEKQPNVVAEPVLQGSLNVEGVCSLIEAKECHQIAHCQLVIGDQDQCSCQDDSCSGKEGQEIASFSSSAVAQPVCGSDHVTYRDVCQLKNAACTKHLNITQIAGVPCEDAGLCGMNGCPFHGMCLRDSELGHYQCACPECYTQDLPNYVCGNDAVTYQSLCHLHQASCLLQKPIIYDYDGYCKKCETCPYGSHCYRGQCKCPTDCPSDYEPVCGTDGRTYNNDCWMMQQTCNNDKIVEIQSKGKCPHPHHTCQKSEDLCECPQGVLDPSCTDCQPGFWAYTSFGCLDCGCSVMGSEKGKCDAYIGKCQCKPGFSGDKCEICPDGSQATLDGCLNRSTKYAEPITCGLNSCDFGATCSGSHCLCEIDCSSKIFYKLPVCGNDGNTYRSECQLRQYSCRIQKDITITKYEPCTDAPSSLYGNGTERQDVLSDGTGTITIYGLIGDQCLDDQDCFMDFTSCIGGVCTCQSGFDLDRTNMSCEAIQKSFCDPNPCKGGGTCEEHDGTFSCYCPPGLAGSYCEHDVSQFALKIASFTGHSWVQIVNPDDMINRFELELSFRSFSENGLLFYAQQDLKMAGSDFISIHLKEGFVEFSFDLGSGPAILKSSQPIKLGHWHHLVAKRYHQDGFLAIDGIDKITGQTVGSIKTLNVDKMAYFGGFGEVSKVQAVSNTGISTGFLGCIKDVQISRQLISIQSELEPSIRKRHEIVECVDNPCARMPCANGGSCQVSHNQGYQCNCKSKFTGRQCQRNRDQCHPNPCQNNGQCIMDDLRGFLCKCGSRYAGRVCQTELYDSDGDRYRKSLQHEFKQKIQFSLKTNNSSLNGLFMKVYLVGTSVNNEEMLHFGINDKSELWIEVFNQRLLINKPIVPKTWHKIVITKQHHRLSFKVGHHFEVLQLDKSWPMISFSEKPILFTELARGQICLKNYHVVQWKYGRKSKSISYDICR